MLPLRYPWVWLVLGWLLVAGVCVGSLVPGSLLPDFDRHDKLVHAGSYFLLMAWFAGVYERRQHVLIAVVLALLGLALDVAQGQSRTRSFDMADVLANGVGILVGFVLARYVFGGWCQRVERLLFA